SLSPADQQLFRVDVVEDAAAHVRCRGELRAGERGSGPAPRLGVVLASLNGQLCVGIAGCFERLGGFEIAFVFEGHLVTEQGIVYRGVVPVSFIAPGLTGFEAAITPGASPAGEE